MEFFAVPNEGRYTTTNVYWLAVGDAPGLRFPTRSAAPAAATLAQRFTDVLRLEEGNGFYELGLPAKEGDPHFFWALFEDNPFGDGITQLDQPMTLAGLDPVGTARIRGLFSGRSSLIGSPDHQAVFSVNGSEVGQTTWDSFLFR
nr:hypothetical protein [Actinomycetota bacterium]